MRTTLTLLLAVVLTGASLADPPAPPTGQDDLLALGEDLIESGLQAVANGPDHDVERVLHRKLRVIRYDENSIDALAEILAANEDEAVMLYVAARLFKPLAYAHQEVALAGTRLVRETYDRFEGYKHLHEYTPDELESMVPAERDDNESDASFERRRQRRAERLEAKLLKDRLVQLYNQNLRTLERQTFTLMIEADKSAYDSELVRWVVASEKDGLMRFTWILEAIRTAARDMDRDRAAQLYGKLKEYLTVESMVERTYADPSNIAIHETENSTYATERIAPGEHLLRTINHLATTAELPALLPPNRHRKTNN